MSRQHVGVAFDAGRVGEQLEGRWAERHRLSTGLRVGEAEGGVEKGDEDGLVAASLRGRRIDGTEELGDLGFAEGGDDPLWWFGDAEAGEGVEADDVLGEEPGEEASDTSDVGADGVTG